jgi:AcrR family transcriptional regulator
MPKSRGVRVAKAEGTRVALLRAARRLFADKGFHATGTPEIVAEAGVTRGALQHHFPRKEDLFLAVFEQVEHDMMQMSPPPSPSAPGDGWVRLKANLSAYLEAATMPEVQRIILLDGPAVLGWAEWRRLEAHYGLGMITDAVEDGMSAGHIRPQPAKPLAHMILSIINEAALMVANADCPDIAKGEARVALGTLLSSLS